MAITNIISKLITQIQQAYQDNLTFLKLYEFLKTPTDDLKLKELTERITLKDNLLYYDKTRIVVPDKPKIKLQIIQEFHDTLFAAHYAYDKTLASIAENFYWPSMAKDIRSFCSSCDTCQRNKARNRTLVGLLQPLPILERN